MHEMAWAEKDQAGTTRRSGDGVNADGGGDDDNGDNGNTSQ